MFAKLSLCVKIEIGNFCKKVELPDGGEKNLIDFNQIWQQLGAKRNRFGARSSEASKSSNRIFSNHLNGETTL